MVKPKPLQPKDPSSYELLGMRVQRAINKPKAQLSKSVLIERSPSDDPADWARILDEISENDNVTISHLHDGLIQILWTVSKED